MLARPVKPIGVLSLSCGRAQIAERDQGEQHQQHQAAVDAAAGTFLRVLM